jgi:hypothetical protein
MISPLTISTAHQENQWPDTQPIAIVTLVKQGDCYVETANTLEVLTFQSVLTVSK